MIINRFAISLVFRIIILLGNMVLISIVIKEPIEKQMVFTLISLCVILILQIIMLFEFLNRTNQNLLRFFMIIFDSDYSIHFQEKVKSSPFIELNRAFNRVIDKYKDLSRDKELHYYYLGEVVKHIKVGIISVNNSGEIGIMNGPASELLQTVKCTSWSRLTEKRPAFTSAVDQMQRRGPVIMKLDLPYDRRNLSVHVTRLKLQDESYRLVTIQDVQNEVEQGEIDATHKLIRILTHEIMNSITPISSLTETISMLLESKKGQEKKLSEITQPNITDIRKSAISIQERIDGLDHFIMEYRKLSQLPKLPDLKELKVMELFETVMNLMSGELQKNRIELIRDIQDQEMKITADSHLLEQVLINLIGNSMDAMKGISDGKICLFAGKEEQGPVIRIIDNGRGISPEQFEQIFIPFYSTKEGGSGIGLSLSRQIMRLHGGSISVQSKPGVETVFTLRF